MATSNLNVLPLPGKRRVRQQQAQRLAPSRRRLAQQHAAAVAVAVVGVVLTGLSLAHLAHGIALLTQAPVWEAWSMAIGIDLAFVALELAQLCAATPTVAKTIGRFTKPAIVGTLVASAGMNALAFGAAATGWMAYPAIALGLAIPALIYCLSRVAFGLAASR